MSLRGIIFDLDGTLGETFPLIFSAFRAGFLKVGRSYSDAEITGFFGPTETGIFKKVSPDRWRDCQEAYLRVYEQEHAEKGRLYPGIRETLLFLKRQGLKLGMVTGKSAESTAISLRYFELENLFDPVKTGAEAAPNKPEMIRETLALWELTPAEVAYLGDAPYDISAARETGLLPLCAAWGSLADLPRIREKNPAQIFESVPQFADWARNEMK